MPVSARALRCLLFLVVMEQGLFAASSPPEKTLTVAQLDQLIGQLKSQNDAKTARELANLRLTERAGISHLTLWEAMLTGSRSRKALLALVDASEFLSTPPAEIGSAAPPDDAGRAILARVNDYVSQSAQKLPDFLATRSTVSFAVESENRMTSQGQPGLFEKEIKAKRSFMQVLGPAETSGGMYAQLYWLGTTSQTVTYRDGKETSEAESASGTVKSPVAITSVGEFGQLLVGLFKETDAQDIIWDRWEELPAGRLAVFRYSVPRERSGFALISSWEMGVAHPAHHGEFAVDPSSGAILRISLIAQLRTSFGQEEAGVVAEFGPTDIGGRSYICILHSAAVARDFDMFADMDKLPQPIPLQTTLNDVSFTDYRVFGSTSRLVTNAKDK